MTASHLLLALGILVSATTQSLAGGSTACSGQIGGGPAVTAIDGDLAVPDGMSCTLSFVTVTGDIRVGRGATLTISATTEPSSIGGSIEARGCNAVVLQGNVTVAGDLDISSCSGTGWSGFQGPDTVINGSFQCRSNAGPCLAWLGTIGENLHIQSNRSPAASDVSLVSVGGSLQCMGNTPAPTRTHGPSWVEGNAEGQCAGFATTTTSIATPAAPMPCANLATLPAAGFPVPGTVITSAVDTPAANGLPQRCIVNGFVNEHISPVDNCRYANAFQVQLPANWNGRFMMQGGGGTEGAVPAATGVTSVSSTFGIVNGYAVASQDGGHLNSDLAAVTCDSGFGNANEFYLDPLGAIAQTYQSIEVTALVAKYLINQFYGEGPHRSYWVGCSTGGRQAMVMSQHFPTFFDGIIAGDPVYDLQAIGLSGIYSVEQILNVYNANPSLPPPVFVPQPAPIPPEPILFPAFPVADQALLETALLQVCDALDGVADGVVDNLPACKAKFDPATATYTSGGAAFPLQCAGAKDATCLSPAQIEAVKNIHRGPRTSRGQTVVAPAGAVAPDHVTSIARGYAWDGGWMSTAGIPLRKIGSPTRPPGAFDPGGSEFGYALVSPPQPTLHALDFNFDTDLGMLSHETPLVTFSTSADIRRFVDLGHKIIWYHGLSDPAPPVLDTIRYYQEMAQQHGGLDNAQRFSRFYPVPNMGHCTGGPATDHFDLLSPLADWVENGIAPAEVPATGMNFTAATYQVSFVTGPAVRTRPLCPYPQQLRFTGQVSIAAGVPVASNPADLGDPANYRCISAPPPLLE